MRRLIWVALCVPCLLAACQGGAGGGWAERECRERLPDAGQAEIDACAERAYRRARAQEYSPRGP